MTSISNVAGNYYKNTDNVDNILNKENNTYMPSMMYDNSDNKYRQDMIQDKSIVTREIISNKSFMSKLFPLFIIIVIVSLLYFVYYIYQTILKKLIFNDGKTVNTDLKKNKKSKRKLSETKENNNPLNKIFDTNKIAEEDGYCYIGYDKGRRHCVEINKDDVCLSGVTYKNENLCIDPELRL